MSPRLGATLLGAALAAAGAGSLNQWMESDRDGRMEYARGRPIPSGRLDPGRALLWGLGCALAGLAVLAAGANLPAAAVAAATLVLYLLVYTPLKTRTALCTLLGALPGAAPPLIGWAAASGGLGRGAWILPGLLFLWQAPHFLSLAWLRREDYRRGGFCVLPLSDKNGRAACEAALLYSLALPPTALMASLAGLAGPVYAVGALVLGAAFVVFALLLYLRRTEESARRLFRASIVYLLLILCLMLADRRPPAAAAPLQAPAVSLEETLP